MQRYFIEGPLTERIVLKDANQCHHIRHVMRMKIGQNIIVCDHSQTCFQMTIIGLNPQGIELEKKHLLNPSKKSFHVTLGQSLIRKDHFELAVQKATELGADTIIPLKTARTIVKIDDAAFSQKRKRWETIMKEASEQSHRDSVCGLDEPMTLDCLDYTPFDLIVVAYEQEKTQHIKTVLDDYSDARRMLVLIGPEGGFTEGEITFLEEKGALSVSLGPRILRSETAAMYALAAISLLWEA